MEMHKCHEVGIVHDSDITCWTSYLLVSVEAAGQANRLMVITQQLPRRGFLTLFKRG